MSCKSSLTVYCRPSNVTLQDLLAYLESVLLRTALIRFNVTTSCLKHIIQVSSSLYRKSEKADQNVSLNPIAAAIVEILLEALHGKARVTPVTMASLVDVSGKLTFRFSQLNFSRPSVQSQMMIRDSIFLTMHCHA